jgi:hypothetical protein
MVAIPEPEQDEFNPAVAFEKWKHHKEQAEYHKAQEMYWRKKIFVAYFPNPKSGVNNFRLNDNTTLKGSQGINYKVDQAVLTAMKEEFKQQGLNPDKLTSTKVELRLSEYKLLTEAQKAVFDQCLIISPGSITLELAIKKEEKE